MNTFSTTVQCLRACLWIGCLAICFDAPPAQAEQGWNEDWKQVQAAAISDESKPILIKFEATWCGPCKLQTEAFNNPEAIHLVSQMHALRVDVDDPPAGINVDEIRSLPTMRIINEQGEVLQEQIGLLEGEALMGWLRAGQQQHQSNLDANRLLQSLGRGSLDQEKTSLLIEMLSDRSPQRRAAAAGILIAHPSEVAASVVSAFEQPKLRTRLSALDVLRRWSAPIDGLDPWNPETINKQSLDRLHDWSQHMDRDSVFAMFSESALQESELELDRLVRRGTPREGIVETLGLSGEQLLPSVDNRLSIETTDSAQQRLSSVRYRLVAAPTLAIRLPEVTNHLASRDAEVRRSAARKLADGAKQEDLPLLETLFGHQDPLIRELALRGLQQAGGSDLKRLTRLLEDPDKNVRAAVLKMWLDNPRASLVQPVSEHALSEQDSGLLVYYVRLLKELNSNSPQSIEALVALATNEDWQVRAAVAETISHRVSEAEGDSKHFGGTDSASAGRQLLDAARQLGQDSDSFVLSKIVPALLETDQAESFDRLLNVAWKFESIRKDVLPNLHDDEGMKNAREFLIARFESEAPQDRQFAIEAMTYFDTQQRESFIKRAIEDENTKVQIAGARALSAWLDDYLEDHEQTPPIPDPTEDEILYGGLELDGSFNIGRSIPVAPPDPIGEAGGFLGSLSTLLGGTPPAKAPANPTTPTETLTPEDAAPPLVEINGPEKQQLDGDESVPSEPAPNRSEQEVNETDDSGEPSNSEEDATADPGDTPSPQAIAARNYNSWLQQWREAPQVELAWLAGLQKRLEQLAEKGGETESYAMLAAARLGSDVTADQVFQWMSSLTNAESHLVSLYPWLKPSVRKTLFESAGKLPDGEDILSELYEQVRRFDPEGAEDRFWQAMDAIDLSQFEGSYYLRQKVMQLTTGSEYFYSSDESEVLPMAEKLAVHLTATDSPTSRLLGLSVMSELSPEKMSDLVGDDFSDTEIDESLRRDWARMALAGRVESEASTLAVTMLADEQLLPVAMEFITQSYEGIAATENGELSISSVDDGSDSAGLLTVARIPTGISAHAIRPLLEHADSSVVAQATFALVVMNQQVELEPLISEMRSEGINAYMSGATNLLVQAIAYRGDDSDVPILEEIYQHLQAEHTYYVRDFYWKIRIMSGPKALALRKRIRREVGMNELT